MSEPGTRSIRSVLRESMIAAMKRQDAGAVAVARTALAAIDNAGAVPLDRVRPAGALQASPVGAGRSDIPRRELSEQDMLDIVAGEVQERQAAVDLIEAADSESATDCVVRRTCCSPLSAAASDRHGSRTIVNSVDHPAGSGHTADTSSQFC